jgi:hypothetical protein
LRSAVAGLMLISTSKSLISFPIYRRSSWHTGATSRYPNKAGSKVLAEASTFALPATR